MNKIKWSRWDFSGMELIIFDYNGDGAFRFGHGLSSLFLFDIFIAFDSIWLQEEKNKKKKKKKKKKKCKWAAGHVLTGDLCSSWMQFPSCRFRKLPVDLWPSWPLTQLTPVHSMICSDPKWPMAAYGHNDDIDMVSYFIII